MLQSEKMLQSGLWMIEKYNFLLNSYVSNVFLESAFEKLPVTWQKSFSQLSLNDLSSIMDDNFCVNRILPLSFLSFRAICVKFFNQTKLSKMSLKADSVTDESKLLKFHVNPKKKHEIINVSKIIYEVIGKRKNINFVDIGSGQGHLGRFISATYNIPVLCLEGDKHNTEKAAKINENFEKDNVLLPYHCNLYIDDKYEKSSWASFLESRGIKEDNSYFVSGLHCCGDLVSKIIDIFKDNQNCSYMIVISCCYHKMTSDKVPMSKLMKTYLKNNIELSYCLRESGCHYYREYCRKLGQNYEFNKLPTEFESQVFRACFQELLFCRSELDRVGKVKMKCKLSKSNLLIEEKFRNYCQKFLKKLDLCTKISNKELELGLQRIHKDWMKVIIINWLRVLLGPIVEYVLLQDRLMYIHELGFSAEIITVFDPDISPRNTAILAYK